MGVYMIWFTKKGMPTMFKTEVDTSRKVWASNNGNRYAPSFVTKFPKGTDSLIADGYTCTNLKLYNELRAEYYLKELING